MIDADIKRIEFTITKNCTSKCKHCSVGDVKESNENINEEIAADFIKKITGSYKVESLMTFGGEPLLHAETVCAIHSAARDCGIEKRQLITNGFFSRDNSAIEKTAEAIVKSGINDVLLSVDAFHQEYIKIEPVVYFAEQLLKYNVPSLRVHPEMFIENIRRYGYRSVTWQ
jgi:MoaA/NifB/PqqE/SkfB family radical SAM enzyme